MAMLNDAMMAVFGYFVGHLIVIDYTYKHRQYVLERCYYEKANEYVGRRNYKQMPADKRPDLLNEYPFAKFVTSDAYIKEDRIHPHEIEEDNKELQKRLDKYNKEFD